jgi:hypothetical protein
MIHHYTQLIIRPLDSDASSKHPPPAGGTLFSKEGGVLPVNYFSVLYACVNSGPGPKHPPPAGGTLFAKAMSTT